MNIKFTFKVYVEGPVQGESKLESRKIKFYKEEWKYLNLIIEKGMSK